VSDPKHITVFLGEENEQHGWNNDCAYTKNIVFSSIVADEVHKFKKSDDYGDGPFEFTDGKISPREILLLLRLLRRPQSTPI